MAYAIDNGSLEGDSLVPRHRQRHLQASPPPSEVEIGDILVRVQVFADETARQSQLRAQAILQAAHDEAARIVEGARQQAAVFVTPAQPRIPSEAVANLSAALDEFADTNRFLVAELARLRDALAEPPSTALPSGQPRPPLPPPLPS